MKLSDVKVGDTLICDGFPCIDAGTRLVVQADAKDELFVPCEFGQHKLSGQVDEATGDLVGLKKA